MQALFLSLVLTAAPHAVTHRYALVVGENAGDATDEVLRFAVADARRVVRTLVDVGGVEASDVTELDGADAKGLEEALAQVSAAIAKRAEADSQLVVYVSAHADDQNLHLRGTHFPLSQLREAVLRAPVGVALLVLDTCRSGSLTRVKGLKPVAGVALNIEAPDLKGRVILTSSGPDEDAQESDQLGGSYFTYHWTTGLRGPADVSHDGRVTLQEAYDYAFARTVESTFANPAGVQHPNFLVDLKGEGDLVLSETAGAKTHLLIAVDAPGDWLVLSDDGGSVLGQFQKGRGPVTFAVSPGAYRVRTRVQGGFLEGRTNVGAGTFAVVREGDLTARVSDTVALRGGGPPWTLDIAASTGPALVSGASWLVGGDVALWRSAALGPFDAWVASGRFRASAGGAGSFLENETDLRLGIGTQRQRGRWVARGAVELGALGVYQSRVPSGPRFGVEGFLGGRGEVGLHWGRLSPFAYVDAGGVLMRTDLGTALGWTASVGLGVELPL